MFQIPFLILILQDFPHPLLTSIITFFSGDTDQENQVRSTPGLSRGSSMPAQKRIPTATRSISELFRPDHQFFPSGGRFSSDIFFCVSLLKLFLCRSASFAIYLSASFFSSFALPLDASAVLATLALSFIGAHHIFHLTARDSTGYMSQYVKY